MNDRNIKRLIDSAQKAFSIKRWKRVCQAFDCTKQSICSHSQTKRFLEKIEENRKVYALNRDYFKYNEYPIGLIGVRKTSIFKGFCSQHDNNIFSSIDLEPQLPIQGEDMFLYHFRTICYELFNKELIFNRNKHSLQEMKKKNNFREIESNYIYQQWEDSLLIQNQGIKLFIERDSKHLLRNLEKISTGESYKDMQFIATFTNFLPIHLSTMINPLFDGYVPTDFDFQPLVSVNIVPLSNRSFICFCWTSEYSEFVYRFLEHIERLGLEKIVNIIAFLESEDVSIRPSFFDNLPVEQKQRLINGIATSHIIEKEQEWDNFPTFINLIEGEKIYKQTD